MYFNLIFYFLFQLAGFSLVSTNLFGYRENPIIFPVLIVMLIATLFFLLYGIYLYIRFREINKFSDSILNMINKQLHFFKTLYEVWLWFMAISNLVIIFNLGLLVDYTDGTYRIYNKEVFIIVNIAVLIFIYLSQKASSIFFTGKLKANLKDLKAGALEESIRLEKRIKKLKWIWIVVFILLLAIFVAGIMKL